MSVVDVVRNLKADLEAMRKERDEARAASKWAAEHTESLEKNWERLVEQARKERDEWRARTESNDRVTREAVTERNSLLERYATLKRQAESEAAALRSER